jgi:branched-chain amino acid transport system ATP-binding protein
VTPALGLEDLTISYGGSPVVHEVTLTVPNGEAVALLGPNGAGKTTLLRAATGLLKPTSGRIVLDGADVTKERPDERARRGLCGIPDGRGVFPSLTVRDNLILQADRGRQAAALELATAAFPALGARLRQVAGTLSGGEQQMLALSRALMSAPKLLLIDEPSVGLAPLLVARTIDSIKALKEGYQLSVLMAEQNFTQAIRIADRGYVIVHGRIEFEGASADDLNNNDIIRELYLGA